MTPLSIINTKALYEYVQKQSENRQFLKFIEISSTFFLISFFLFFAVRPTVLVISALVGEIKSKETLSLQMKNKIDRVIMAEDAFSQIQENYSLVEASLPSRPSYSSIADYINGSAQQSQVETNTVNFNLKPEETSQKKQDSNIDSYGLSSSIKGDFSSILSFLDKLLHSRRVIDIKSVSLSNHKSNNSQEQAVPNGTIDLGVAPIIYYWQGSEK